MEDALDTLQRHVDDGSFAPIEGDEDEATALERGLIRHIAINILTNDKVFKAGLRRKMRKAAMDRNYLASVLTGSGLS